MNNHTHLLSFPFELRDAIWTLCSTTTDSHGLLRCCRQTRDEFTLHCVLTEDVEKLQTLRIWVDSSYNDGIWLKFDYTWEKDGYYHRAADPDLGHVEINFLTETRQPGQTAKEARNFWECRSPKALQEPIRKYWRDARHMPRFYEYFLISHPTCSNELQRQTTTRYLRRCELQQRIVEWSANSMTRARWTRNRDVIDFEQGLPLGRSFLTKRQWEHIYYDRENLMSRFQFWLDNLPGPFGGPMDMLRLHRFKTMNKCGAGFFARQTQSFPNSGGPHGASTEINRRLATLFDPFAAAHIIQMRDGCPHLRAVGWATAPLSEHGRYTQDETWLKFYSKGIRYNWDRRNLVEWILHWLTRNYNRREKNLKGYFRGNNVCLHQWWECVASYQDSGAVLNELALPVERQAPHWTLKSFPSHPQDSERPVLIRRDRDEYIVRCLRKGRGYTIFNYCSMAWRSWDWANYTGSGPFFHNDEDLIPESSKIVYSPQGLQMFVRY
ncbi:hypothetical protein FLONG3_11283 [Fusarium longipes]|uniref:Uncharacterized protein n=1 Tax=Fusarium longipes TaxID=694270 RepID=A0A395RH43_9HYPO|nr:hypothetical protein FLONG3_11283 [Fusarium longipes]